MAFTAADVKNLREMTGVGMMDCKKALTACEGDMDKAMDYLREKSLAASAKKAARIAAEGIVSSYVTDDHKVGAIVEVNCETDFVANTDRFRALVHDVAMHIAAAKPEYLDRADVPTANLEKEKEILRAQALNEGKPEKIVERMVEGRIEKYYKEVCLMEQPFVKDPDKTIKDLISDATVAIGEKISIRRFVRFERGEGIEKRQDNLAAEIAENMKKAGL